MIEELEQAANDLLAAPLPDNDVDVAGRLGHVIQKLSGYRRGLIAEITEPTAGEHYRASFGRRATRSYNTAAILKAFADQGVALSDLVSKDVARINWRWSELKEFAYHSGVQMVIAPNEIEDLGDVDGPLVGEVWTDDVRIEGK